MGYLESVARDAAAAVVGNGPVLNREGVIARHVRTAVASLMPFQIRYLRKTEFGRRWETVVVGRGS